MRAGASGDETDLVGTLEMLAAARIALDKHAVGDDYDRMQLLAGNRRKVFPQDPEGKVFQAVTSPAGLGVEKRRDEGIGVVEQLPEAVVLPTFRLCRALVRRWKCHRFLGKWLYTGKILTCSRGWRG